MQLIPKHKPHWKQPCEPLLHKVISGSSDPYATLQKQTDYIAAKATLTGNSTHDQETIITQKYIALFLQPEVWNDYRRTGYPAIPGAQMPRTALIPTDKFPAAFPTRKMKRR